MLLSSLHFLELNNYKTLFFPLVLDTPNVSQEDWHNLVSNLQQNHNVIIVNESLKDNCLIIKILEEAEQLLFM